MQEYLDQQFTDLSIKSGKMTAKVLAEAMTIALREMEKRKRMRSASKNQKASRTRDTQKVYKGKQTLTQLSKNGSLQNIPITEQNIKAFEPVARKYNIDYALHKDKSEEPPKWLVFFKAKDADVLTLAFKEFTAKVLKKEEKKRNAPVTFRDLQKKYSKQYINDKRVKLPEMKKFKVKSRKKDIDKAPTFKSLQKKFGKKILNNKKVRIRERGDR